MSYSSTIYHIVFRTKFRENTIPIKHERILYAYLYGTIKANGGYTYRIGGMPNHIHILCSIPTTISVSDFIRNLKRASSIFLKSDANVSLFPLFKGWSPKFAAFSRCASCISQQIQYIANQKEHHKVISFEDEYMSLLNEGGIGYDETYLFTE